jgi:hypothetical protein
MCHLGSNLAKALNRIDQIRGSVFERRFSEIVIADDGALPRRIAYAVANPVSANLVRSHVEWSGLCLYARAEAARAHRVPSPSLPASRPRRRAHGRVRGSERVLRDGRARGRRRGSGGRRRDRTRDPRAPGAGSGGAEGRPRDAARPPELALRPARGAGAQQDAAVLRVHARGEGVVRRRLVEVRGRVPRGVGGLPRRMPGQPCSPRPISATS